MFPYSAMLNLEGSHNPYITKILRSNSLIKASRNFIMHATPDQKKKIKDIIDESVYCP